MKHAFPLAGLLLLIGGCASTNDSRYPSLRPRPIESRSDAEPVVPPPPEAKPDAALDAKLAAFRTTLNDTTRAFAPAADRAEAAARAARGDSVGSERWIAAQSALAELDGYRATLSATLTDVEQLAIDRAAATEPDYPGIEELRGSVKTAFDAETARITAIQAMLPAA